MSNTSSESVVLVRSIQLQEKKAVSLAALFGGAGGQEELLTTLERVSNQGHDHPWLAWKEISDIASAARGLRRFRLVLAAPQLPDDLRLAPVRSVDLTLDVGGNAVTVTRTSNLDLEGTESATPEVLAALTRIGVRAINQLFAVTVARQLHHQIRQNASRLQSTSILENPRLLYLSPHQQHLAVQYRQPVVRR